MANAILGASIDTATTRFIALAKAARLSGDLPATTAKDFLDRATAIRFYALALEHGLALSVLTPIEKMGKELASTSPDLSTAVLRHHRDMKKALSFRLNNG